MFTTEQVRQTFTDWAPRYDATHGWRLLKRREVRLVLGVQPSDRVLEIACALNIIPEYEHAIAEVQRVLVPGGRFVALEMQRIELGSLSGWLGDLAHKLIGVCAVDTSHRSLEAIQSTFGEVQVRRYLARMVFIALARK